MMVADEGFDDVVLLHLGEGGLHVRLLAGCGQRLTSARVWHLIGPAIAPLIRVHMHINNGRAILLNLLSVSRCGK